ncbi:hypothetical protein E2C01_089485 [Portunus trituberculatus]|uniref:Uncharacterized protein n=1 Tax=Portunus trituberculatus TaxID=210409 RepID=A0A5B7J8X4_PORTR|nr:hypothetical protein [Portunus trituberculatus]
MVGRWRQVAGYGAVESWVWKWVWLADSVDRSAPATPFVPRLGFLGDCTDSLISKTQPLLFPVSVLRRSFYILPLPFPPRPPSHSPLRPPRPSKPLQAGPPALLAAVASLSTVTPETRREEAGNKPAAPDAACGWAAPDTPLLCGRAGV